VLDLIKKITLPWERRNTHETFTSNRIPPLDGFGRSYTRK